MPAGPTTTSRAAGPLPWLAARQPLAALSLALAAALWLPKCSSFGGWLRDGREVPGIVGAMYTTWQHRYHDLEAFARQLQAPQPGGPRTVADANQETPQLLDGNQKRVY